MPNIDRVSMEVSNAVRQVVLARLKKAEAQNVILPGQAEKIAKEIAGTVQHRTRVAANDLSPTVESYLGLGLEASKKLGRKIDRRM